MEYFGTLFLMLAMMLMTSMVGRRICDFASFRLAPVYRFYFSPLFGLAFFILIFTVHGWLVPFKTWSSVAITSALVLAALYFEKEKKNLPRYLLAICLFSLLASSPVLFPLLRFDAYNPFNDTFTYLVHGQWLQTHSFSEHAIASGHHPALTQVAQYQSAGHRMGASFLLAWAQSVFGVEWSYYVYPAVVSLPLIAGGLAVGGAVKIIVRRQRLISMLAGAGAATMFNGFAFGAIYGFFPQTFGLAFAVGSTTLLGAMLTEGLRKLEFKTVILNSVPAALLFAALILTYNDMLPFVALGAAFSIAFLLIKSDQKTRILKILLVLLAGIALLVNFELVRVIRNFIGTLLNVAGTKFAIGWPVLWSPIEFLAHAFGFKSPIGELWILKYEITTLPILIFVVLAVLYFVATNGFRGKKYSLYVALHFFVVLAMTAGFLYFRYLGQGPTPQEAGFGQTFLEFKLAKWASPFCFVLLGATFAYFHGKWSGRYSKLIPSSLIALLALGAAGNYRSAAAITNNFLDETGYRRSAFSSLEHLRELANHLSPKEVIYLNLGAEHQKLRQMIAYVLYDKKLAADYSDDGYILGNLPPDQRNIPFQTAGWVIDFAGPDVVKSMSSPMAGNLVLKRRPDYLLNLASITGGYARETDGVNWWNWTAGSLSYSYRVLGNLESVRLKFKYMPAVEGRKIKIIVGGKTFSEFSLKMKGGWNEFVSPPIEVGGSKDISVRFISEDKPVRISEGDPRLMSFLIQNLELVPTGGAAAQKLPQTKVNLIDVSGGYSRETEGEDWWYWTADKLVFNYVLTPADAEKRRRLRLKFTYLPASPGRNIKITVKSGDSEVTFPLALKKAWNDFVSEPIIIEGRDITVSFVSDEKPVHISKSDTRLMSFLIKNLELVDVESGALAGNDRAKRKSR